MGRGDTVKYIGDEKRLNQLGIVFAAQYIMRNPYGIYEESHITSTDFARVTFTICGCAEILVLPKCLLEVAEGNDEPEDKLRDIGGF